MRIVGVTGGPPVRYQSCGSGHQGDGWGVAHQPYALPRARFLAMRSRAALYIRDRGSKVFFGGGWRLGPLF